MSRSGKYVSMLPVKVCGCKSVSEGCTNFFIFQRPETDYIKMNVMSVKARQRSVEAAGDPLKPPSTYQRGVIPK